MVAIATSVSLLGGVRGEDSPAPESRRLGGLLARLERLAGLYQDQALSFTCDETLVHYSGRGQRSYRFRYTYVFDEHGKLRDYRTRHTKGRSRGKAGGKVPKPISLETYERRHGMPAPLRNAYVWINVFDRARRDVYRYELAGVRRVLDRPAIGVTFEPVPPYVEGVNHWYGTAWIDRETSQLLRVEALEVQEYLKKRKLERHLAQPPSGRRRVRASQLIWEVSTDYGVAKNGLRFPSEVLTRASRYEVWARAGRSGYREHTVFRLRQAYDNYLFFGVRTEHEVFRTIHGDGEPLAGSD